MEKKPKRNILVGISGASSSGKTTVANVIHALLEGSVLVHEDDFYVPDNEIPFDKEKNQYNWDSAECVKFDELKSTLSKFKEHGVDHDYSVESLELETKMKLSDKGKFEIGNLIKSSYDPSSVNVIILEGFLLFHDEEILNLLDIKLFFKSDYITLRNRRYGRTGYNTVAGFWEDPPMYFEDIVWPEYIKNHLKLFKSTLDAGKTLEDEVKLTGGVESDYAKGFSIGFFHNSNGDSFDKLVLDTTRFILDKI